MPPNVSPVNRLRTTHKSRIDRTNERRLLFVNHNGDKRLALMLWQRAIAKVYVH